MISPPLDCNWPRRSAGTSLARLHLEREHVAGGLGAHGQRVLQQPALADALDARRVDARQAQRRFALAHAGAVGVGRRLGFLYAPLGHDALGQQGALALHGLVRQPALRGGFQQRELQLAQLGADEPQQRLTALDHVVFAHQQTVDQPAHRRADDLLLGRRQHHARRIGLAADRGRLVQPLQGHANGLHLCRRHDELVGRLCRACEQQDERAGTEHRHMPQTGVMHQLTPQEPAPRPGQARNAAAGVTKCAGRALASFGVARPALRGRRSTGSLR